MLNLATLVSAVRHGRIDTLSRIARAYQILDPLGHATAPRDSKIEEIAIEQIVPEPESVQVDVRFAHVDGSLPIDELIRILMIVHHADPIGILEIGTYFGSSTLNFALNAPRAKVHTADLPPTYDQTKDTVRNLAKDDFHLIKGRRLGAAFHGHTVAQRITQHLGDTATFNFGVIRNPIDLVFIDGSHTYDYAKSDTLRCRPILDRTRAVTVLWHDYDRTHPGVIKWLFELQAHGLPVKRVQRTNLGYLRLEPESELTQKFFALPD